MIVATRAMAGSGGTRGTIGATDAAGKTAVRAEAGATGEAIGKQKNQSGGSTGLPSGAPFRFLQGFSVSVFQPSRFIFLYRWLRSSPRRAAARVMLPPAPRSAA